MIIILTLIGYFAALLLIARLTGRSGGTNAAFFRGENKSPWYVVAFGMIGASISGVTFVSVPGWVRSSDMTYMQMVVGFFFGYLIVAHVLLPLYYRLNLTSIYTYLGTRLGPQSYRTGSLFFLLSRMLGTAAKLYLVCLILYHYVFATMDIPFWVIAVGAVALVWVYTQKSGIRTIVWTDSLQTFCLILALILILVAVGQRLNMNIGQMITAVADNAHSRIWVWDDWVSPAHAVKQLLSGVFVVIVMTGLDQDMMQKNLTCRTLKEAQKNMYAYGFAFIPLNLLFLGLGVLLLILGQQLDLTLPASGDDILPMLATEGYLGQSVLVLFTIGIVAAAFSNSDSALAAMTTSFCVDILHTDKEAEPLARRKRRQVHALMAIVLVLFICSFKLINSQSVINAIYVIASYTYGPLLGMFAFGLFTKRAVDDRFVPYVAIASPMLCYAIEYGTQHVWGYHFGYELLMLNGLFTFVGLFMFSKVEKTCTNGNK